MEDYFDREMLAIERELRQLKTSAQRSSGTIETASQTIQVSVPLSLNSSQTICRGEIYYEIITESDSLVSVTLDWYHQNVMDEWKIARTSRYIIARTVSLNNGNIGVRISAQGTNWSSDQSDDLNRIKKGESININANMTVQCTNNFTIRKV